ncbi:MAG: FAD-binding protein [Rhodocyclaceae bacterium]|nr:FAD-binding protein [Rhodocyclaceae bacterium]
MEENRGTLIVGGGMAGMFCAMRLKEAGLPFLMLTERLGLSTRYCSTAATATAIRP